MLPNVTRLVTHVAVKELQLLPMKVPLVINNVRAVVKDGTLWITMGQPVIKVTMVMENVSHAF